LKDVILPRLSRENQSRLRVARFVPQEQALEHSSVSIFVTNASQNGVMEALIAVVYKGDNSSFVLLEMPNTTRHGAIKMPKPEGDQRKLLEYAIGGFAPDGGSLTEVCREFTLRDQARFDLELHRERCCVPAARREPLKNRAFRR